MLHYVFQLVDKQSSKSPTTDDPKQGRKDPCEPLLVLLWWEEDERWSFSTQTAGIVGGVFVCVNFLPTTHEDTVYKLSQD